MRERLFWVCFKRTTRRNIPQVLTLGNLVLGTLALLFVLEGYYERSISLVFIAMVLDGLDGKLAVRLKACSDLGKQLDSLCDLVSFGVVPAVIMYGLVFSAYGLPGMLITLFFPVAGAYRLARFNITSSSTPGFTGLPITIAGGALTAMALHSNLIATPGVVLAYASLISVLMVSRVAYPALIKGQREQNPILYLLLFFAAISFIIFVIFLREMLFYLLLSYVAFGILNGLYQRLFRKEKPLVSYTAGSDELDL